MGEDSYLDSWFESKWEIPKPRSFDERDDDLIEFEDDDDDSWDEFDDLDEILDYGSETW